MMVSLQVSFMTIQSLFISSSTMKLWILSSPALIFSTTNSRSALSTGKRSLRGGYFPSIFDIKTYFLSLSPGQLSLLSQVKRLMLVLVMPATNASSERSFSALRRVKNYLRTTMPQERLNHLMLLHVHKEKTDALDLKVLLNEFIESSDHRCNIFAKY